MKILRQVLLILLSIFLLLLVISFFLPDKVHIERAITIKTKASVPYNLVNNLKVWQKWSPWYAYDTAVVQEFSEFAEGEGSWYSWKSNVVGNGKLTILTSKPNELIKTKLDLGDMGINYATFYFSESNNEVKVVWTLDSEGEGMPWYFIPASKYFNLFLDDVLGKDYEKGLKKLKEISESQPQLTIAGFNASVKNMPAISYIGIRRVVKFAEISNNISEIYTLLFNTLQKQNSQPIGAPFTINYSANNQTVDMEAALPVGSTINVAEPIKKQNIPAGNALVVSYKGNYNNLGSIYGQAIQWINANGKKLKGAPMEFYITDPMMEKDTAKWLTEVVFPIE